MSKTLHFIVIATAEQLAKAWPDAPRYTNTHTDPMHFTVRKFTNYSMQAAWNEIVSELGEDIDDDGIEWGKPYQYGDVNDYSLQMVSEDEADDMIREAESYLTPLDLTDDDS